MTPTIPMIMQLAEQGVDPRTIALKVYASAAFERQVCGYTGQTPVTGTLANMEIIKAADRPTIKPIDRDGVSKLGWLGRRGDLVRVLAGLHGIDPPERLIRQPGEPIGKSVPRPVLDARAALIVLLIDALGYSRRDVGVMMNYTLSRHGCRGADFIYTKAKTAPRRSPRARQVREAWAAWLAFSRGKKGDT